LDSSRALGLVLLILSATISRYKITLLDCNMGSWYHNSRHSKGWAYHIPVFVSVVAVMLLSLDSRQCSAVTHRAAVSSHIHCPAALAAARINKGFFSYPLDIYGDMATAPQDGAPTFVTTNCSASDTWNQGQHQCPNQLVDGHCPITADLIKEFMKFDGPRASEVSNARLCSFIESARLSKGPTSPKIVVFGGSETNGADTRGCCCCHPSCPAGYEQTKHCRWSHYLLIALRQRLYNNIDVVNLAHGGWNSAIIAENIRQSLESSNTTLRSNDLVILEPSVNDCASFDAQQQVIRDMTGTGMERAIRNLMTISKVKPAFLLLEVYPLSRVRNKVYNYSTYYRSVARHYNATSWSFTDVASKLLSSNQSNPVAKALNFQLNRKGISTNHPGWHVHLYLADLIVSALLMTEGLCRASSVSSMSQARLKPDDCLPPYLYPTKTPLCDESVPPILDASALAFRPENTSYSVTMKGNWKLWEDRVGKPGWIIDNLHDTASTNNSITFSVGQIEQSAGNAIIVAVTYLTTYENCGMVKVRICDQLTAEIDSTLPSWETRNISVDAVHYYYLNTTACSVVSFEQIPATKSMQKRQREKFKITAVKICRQEH
jgi:lysophospholipase L1-like esterase